MKKNMLKGFKNVIGLMMILVLSVSLFGCSKPKDEVTTTTTQEPAVTTTTEEVATTTTTEETIELPSKDRAGNDIKIPQDVEKIVSLAPAITKILVDLGFGDKIIAIDNYSKGIQGIDLGIPEFDMLALNIEAMVALDADIIFASSMSDYEGKDLFKTIKDLGTAVVGIPSSESIQGIKDDIAFIGQTLKASDRSQELIDIMEAEIDKIAAIGATIENKKTVHFEISAAPYIYSFGSGTYLNEMIEIVGAKNIYGDQQSWLPITEELAIVKNPDVILTSVNYMENPIDEIISRPGWENVNAVMNKDVYYINNEESSQPCHYIVIALRQMAEAIYPDMY